MMSQDFRPRWKDRDRRANSPGRESGKGRPKRSIAGSSRKGLQTAFSGYEEIQSESKILKLIKGDETLASAREGDEIEVITERTPFYGEAGGQVGDQGLIFYERYSLEVTNTLKPLEDLIVHQARVKRGEVKEGMEASLRVDPVRRRATALNHTGTHLLQAVLREVLGDHVRQAGSFVSAERLRFDFTHFAAIEKGDLSKIEALVNQKVRENLKINTQTMAVEEAIQMGAMALFGEKYGERVRVVMASDFSIELCGGTHTSMDR